MEPLCASKGSLLDWIKERGRGSRKETTSNATGFLYTYRCPSSPTTRLPPIFPSSHQSPLMHKPVFRVMTSSATATTSAAIIIVGGLTLMLTGFTLCSFGKDRSSARYTYLHRLDSDMQSIESLVRTLDKSRITASDILVSPVSTSATTAATTAEAAVNSSSAAPGNASVQRHSLRPSDVDPKWSVYYSEDLLIFKEKLMHAHKELKEDWKSLALLEMKLAYKAGPDTRTTATTCIIQNA